MTSTEYIF